MKTKFSDSDMRNVWAAFRNKVVNSVEELSMVQHVPIETAQMLYDAARRRWGKPDKEEKPEKPVKVVKQKVYAFKSQVPHFVPDPPPAPFVRVKGVYSNTSPYGIAGKDE